MTIPRKDKLEKITVEPLVNKTKNSEIIQGWQLQGAPQTKLTAPDNTAFSGSYDANAIAVITNMRTRILELENALVKLNLIKTR